MTALTARNVALTDQVVAVLRDAWPDPLPTGEIAKRAGSSPWRNDTWRVLDRLARQGLIERVPVEYSSSRYWRHLVRADEQIEVRNV